MTIIYAFMAVFSDNEMFLWGRIEKFLAPNIGIKNGNFHGCHNSPQAL